MLNNRLSLVLTEKNVTLTPRSIGLTCPKRLQLKVVVDMSEYRVRACAALRPVALPTCRSTIPPPSRSAALALPPDRPIDLPPAHVTQRTCSRLRPPPTLHVMRNSTSPSTLFTTKVILYVIQHETTLRLAFKHVHLINYIGKTCLTVLYPILSFRYLHLKQVRFLTRVEMFLSVFAR